MATNPNIIEKEDDVNIQESKLLNESNLPSSNCKNITPSTSRSSRTPTQSLATNSNIIEDDDVNFQAFEPKLSNESSLPSLKRKNITFSTSRSSINSSINTQTFASESPNLPLTPVCTSKWK